MGEYQWLNIDIVVKKKNKNKYWFLVYYDILWRRMKKIFCQFEKYQYLCTQKSMKYPPKKSRQVRRSPPAARGIETQGDLTTEPYEEQHLKESRRK